MDKVGLFMTEKVHSIGPNDSVLDAARKMVQLRCRSLLVKEQEEFLGIVTEGDITRKVVAQGLDTREVPVGRIMSSPIITVTHEESMPRVFILMQQNNFRHMPVTARGKIVGMLSVTDFLKYFSARFGLDHRDHPAT